MAADVTPEMIAAAWGAWHSRHGGKLGPGPAFAEAIKAALAASPPAPAEVEPVAYRYHHARYDGWFYNARRPDDFGAYAIQPLYTAEALSAARAQARREALEEAAKLAGDVIDQAKAEARRIAGAMIDRAISDAAPAEEGWRPIETAPRDGAPVDLWVRPHDALANGNAGRIADCVYRDGAWLRPMASDSHGYAPVSECGTAVYWRPAPSPPAGGRDGE